MKKCYDRANLLVSNIYDYRILEGVTGLKSAGCAAGAGFDVK